MTSKTKVEAAKDKMNQARKAYNLYGGVSLWKELKKAEKKYDTAYKQLTGSF